MSQNIPVIFPFSAIGFPLRSLRNVGTDADGCPLHLSDQAKVLLESAGKLSFVDCDGKAFRSFPDLEAVTFHG